MYPQIVSAVRLYCDTVDFVMKRFSSFDKKSEQYEPVSEWTVYNKLTVQQWESSREQMKSAKRYLEKASSERVVHQNSLEGCKWQLLSCARMQVVGHLIILLRCIN